MKALPGMPPTSTPAHRRRPGGLLGAACRIAAVLTFTAALALVGVLLFQARGVLDLGFLLDAPSRFAERAGVGPALGGTLWLALLTAAFSFPVGVGAAVYFEEYAPRTRTTSLIEAALTNMAGVPPVVYGVVGLALFVRGMGLGPTILAGGLTLAMLALPTVLVATRTALRQVPRGVRSAALALGATRWQVIRHQVLPAAAPGIVAGLSLALTRSLGAAAPLLVIGAATFVSHAPRSPGDVLAALPTQIFTWSTRSQPEFGALAAGAAAALLLLIATVNLGAHFLRRRLAGALR